MGGLFGVVSRGDCVEDLFYGTDYHSHLGTQRGGLAVVNSDGYERVIHDITNDPFRSKFQKDITEMRGNMGIGVISDYDPQPLLIGSRLGNYAIATVGRVHNLDTLVEEACRRGLLFSEMARGGISPTEMVAHLVNQGSTFETGIRYAQETIQGSCSFLLLSDEGIYAVRDRLGRTPIIIGKKERAYAATSETCAFPNLGFKIERYLGPGEIVLITPEKVEQKRAPDREMQICSFLWVYYGFPASGYEDINVEKVRYRCGAALARRDMKDGIEVDMVAGIPDSGTAHAIGYANEAGILLHMRPFVKYTPTWARSFMPQDQKKRDEIARMKLIPIEELIRGKRILFAEDSIVRGTQLKDTIKRLFDIGAREVHMRPACPPLAYGCDFLNFSRSKSVMDLAARKSIEELEGRGDVSRDLLSEYSNPNSGKYRGMVERTRIRLGLTSLKYQRLEDLVEAIGLPKEMLCTHCWDGSSYF